MITEEPKTKIGTLLREQRDSLKLTLEAVHKRTRISVPYLEGLENEAYDVFPAEVYLIGFMKQYAKFLSLDSDKIFEMYLAQKRAPDAPASKPDHKSPNLPPSLPHEQSQSRNRAPAVLLLVLLTLLAAGILGRHLFEDNSAESEPVAQGEPAHVAAPEASTTTLAKHTLEAVSLESSWLRITSDGKLVFEGVLPKGIRHRWEASQKFTVRSGYTPGVELIYDGKTVDLKRVAKNNVAELVLSGEKPE